MNTNTQSCSPLCKTTVLLSILKKRKERERRVSATQRGLIPASVRALFFFMFFCLSTVQVSGGRDWLYCPPRQRGQAVTTELITVTATPEKKKKKKKKKQGPQTPKHGSVTLPRSNLHGRNTARDGPKCGRKEGR